MEFELRTVRFVCRQALNIPTKINRGTVEITNDVHLIKAGEKVGGSEATLLSKLGIKPFSYGLVILQVNPFTPNNQGALNAPCEPPVVNSDPGPCNPLFLGPCKTPCHVPRKPFGPPLSELQSRLS
jgi:hypothetical protein